MSTKPDFGKARRRFMAMSSATTLVALASEALGKRIGGPWTSASNNPEDDFPATGYRPFTTQLAHSSDEASVDVPQVVAANSLLCGDPMFLAAGAKVTIHGLATAGSTGGERGVRALSVRVPFEVSGADCASCIDYLAWQYENSPLRHVSPPVSFTVPVERTGALRLNIDVDYQDRDLSRRLSDALVLGKPATSRQPMSHQLRLSVGAGPGSPKLRPGTYFIAIDRSAKTFQPNWHRLRHPAGVNLEAVAGRDLTQSGSGEFERVPFDYLVMSVDYASGFSVAAADIADSKQPAGTETVQAGEGDLPA